MPGMAANPSIFENIKLPSQFKIHWLEWEIPSKNESLELYAKRMSKKILHENSVLIGVSFGGILVQEMSAFLNLSKLIIISSIKTKLELPRRMRIAKRTGLYKFVPTQLANKMDALAKYNLGKVISKRLELYKKYFSVNDKVYLDWAIQQIVCWNRAVAMSNIIHIHGDKDAVFPIRYIKKPKIVVEGGTHVMVVIKFKWFNDNLPQIIMDKNK